MKLATACLVLALPACSAATSALGALTGPKPPTVTVLNTINMPVAAAPVVVAPTATAAVDRPRSSATSALVGGGLAGAVVGGLAAASLHGSSVAIATTTAAGAGVGAAVGFLVRQIAD